MQYRPERPRSPVGKGEAEIQAILNTSFRLALAKRTHPGKLKGWLCGRKYRMLIQQAGIQFPASTTGSSNPL